jgi:uncharacterized membrane protein
MRSSLVSQLTLIRWLGQFTVYRRCGTAGACTALGRGAGVGFFVVASTDRTAAAIAAATASVDAAGLTFTGSAAFGWAFRMIPCVGFPESGEGVCASCAVTCVV